MNKLVQTKFGMIRGLVKKNILGGEYFSFKGIPYAEPPVGKLRFQVCSTHAVNSASAARKCLVTISFHNSRVC